jgi:hypothetical protein
MLVRTFLPGTLIVSNMGTPHGAPAPASNEIPFEPMDLAEDGDALRRLITANLERQGVEEEPEQGPSVNPGVNPPEYGACLVVHVMLICGLVRVASGSFARGLNFAAILLVFIAAILLWRAAAPLLRETKWWLVPGGLVLREFRLWRRSVDVRLFTPETTPLFMDARSGIGVLLDGDRPVIVPCRGRMAWVIAAGWISRARTPSLSEVRAFAGGEGRS